MIGLQTVYRYLKRGFDVLVSPLRPDESITQFTLSVPEAQTTTVDSVQGIHNRPPVVVACRECNESIVQHQALDRIDCGNCWQDYPADDVGDLEVLGMVCPRCEADMQHGRRHPEVFDVPEWATCPDCQYHWDLAHWF